MNIPVSATSVTSLSSKSGNMLKESISGNNTILVALQETSRVENTSLATYQESQQDMSVCRSICLTELLLLFQDSAHIVAMIKHLMDVAMISMEHLDPSQKPVVTFNQPLFPLTKEIQ